MRRLLRVVLAPTRYCERLRLWNQLIRSLTIAERSVNFEYINMRFNYIITRMLMSGSNDVRDSEPEKFRKWAWFSLRPQSHLAIVLSFLLPKENQLVIESYSYLEYKGRVFNRTFTLPQRQEIWRGYAVLDVLHSVKHDALLNIRTQRNDRGITILRLPWHHMRTWKKTVKLRYSVLNLSRCISKH